MLAGVAVGCRVLLAVILGLAFIGKLSSRSALRGFADSLTALPWIPRRSLALLAAAILVAEGASTVLLVLPGTSLAPVTRWPGPGRGNRSRAPRAGGAGRHYRVPNRACRQRGQDRELGYQPGKGACCCVRPISVCRPLVKVSPMARGRGSGVQNNRNNRSAAARETPAVSGQARLRRSRRPDPARSRSLRRRSERFWLDATRHAATCGNE